MTIYNIKNMENTQNIPRRGWKPDGFPVADTLRKLAVNESCEIPRKHWTSIASIASQIGIEVTTRTLGSKETVTVYRVG